MKKREKREMSTTSGPRFRREGEEGPGLRNKGLADGLLSLGFKPSGEKVVVESAPSGEGSITIKAVYTGQNDPEVKRLQASGYALRLSEEVAVV